MGALQREVQQLSRAGILRRIVRGRQVFYQANSDCPIYNDLKQLVVKTVGVGDVIRSTLMPLGDRINVAFMFGSMASASSGRDSDVDLMVVGNVGFGEVVSALGKAQEALSREINPAVYPLDEFTKKVSKGHHFFSSVLKGEKVFIIGDENDLEKMAGEQMADRA